jgi:ABC-type multidrug transport system ATPase subunit
MADDKVIVFTTHRYDSIPQGTTIVVLVDGRIAEIGTHEELVQRQRHYWSLWTSGRDQATRTRAVHNGRLRATAYTPLSPPPLKSGDSSASRDPEPARPQHTWTGGGPPATGEDDHSRQRWDVYPGEEIEPRRQHVR